MSYQVIDPFLEFTNPANGQPIGIGSVYFGRPDSDPKNQPANRINVYAVQDNGTEVLLSQPITLNAAGQPQYNGSPKQLKIALAGSDTSYCVQVFDKNGAQKLYTARVVPAVDVNNLGDVNSSVVIAGVQAQYLASQVFDVRQYGAKGDGTTNDTAAVQAAIDAAVAKGGGTVYFPSGTYIVRSVNVRWGVTLLGAGNSVIKRPNNAGNWVRTITTENNLWDSTVDSPPLVLRNLILDGNRDNQGPYTSYQLEQSHLLFIVAQTTKGGRLRCFVDSCSFINNVADGVSQFTNTDLSITNSYMSNCFRGGLVVTGGFSRIRASNLIIKGEVNSRGIDFEIDGGGFGGSFDVIAELSNIDVNSHFDLSVKGNSRVVASNITFGDISNYRAFYVASDGNSTIQISNSTFLIAGGAGSLNQIRFCNNVAFDNVNFVLTNFGSVVGGNIGIEVYSNTKRYLRMSGCSFDIQAGSALGDNF